MTAEQQPPTKPEPNLTVSGDESRILMMALLQCNVRAPASMTISLYTKLAEISYAQPPQQQNGPQNNL